MSSGKVVVGTLAKLAIGAIAGILLAPEKGSTTRKQIMAKGNGYVDKLKSTFDEFRDSLAEQFESTKKDAEEFVDRGKAQYFDAKKEVKNAAANFKHAGAEDIKSTTL